MNVSKHITLDEATFSATAKRLGINNTPSAGVFENMELVADKCFEPLREWYGKPIKVNSFFRCDALNQAVKGSKSSQHVKGEAIDISAGSKEENEKLFNWLKDNVEFTQLINEYDFSWVHVSYDKNNLKKQILIVK